MITFSVSSDFPSATRTARVLGIFLPISTSRGSLRHARTRRSNHWSIRSTMLGLVSREQYRERPWPMPRMARPMPCSGCCSARVAHELAARAAQEGRPLGFFYGESKVLFHLAEGTFARVYRGEHDEQRAAARDQGAPPAIRPDPRGRPPVPQGGRGRHAAPPPNIVRIIDVGAARQSTLHDHGVCRGDEPPRLPEAPRAARSHGHALPLMLGLAQGLKYSLEQGVTHRDIKGTNILISNSGVAKLVDFGLATIEGDESKHERQEPANRRLLGPRADLQAAPRETRDPTSISSAASSTRC